MRRLLAGFLAEQIGRGGTLRLARITGLDRKTIAKGRHELESRDLNLDRVRRPGGGRKSVEKKRRN